MGSRPKHTKAAQAAAETIAQRIDDAGTPETLAKARYDVMQGLAARGRVTAAESGAAAEIGQVQAALGRSMFPARELDTSLRGTGAKHNMPINYLDRMSADEIEIYEKHWMPWASAMGKVQWIGCPVNVLAVVVAICWDNDSLCKCEARFNMQPRTSMGILRYGLRAYVKIAGL